ncbi:MAG TPA: RNA polymerase sporulation sigma factor SigH [Actinomycetota bacterium]|nr:RNA polymerase sporulation sigma factor SigH [Actinomycetota bacterium]
MGSKVATRQVDLTDLSDEELVTRYQSGDARSVEILLTRYRHVAQIKARNYFLAGGGNDDLVQEGMIGLYKAIRDYRAGKNATFRTFADVCIGRQIVSAIKMATRHKHEPLNTRISLSGPFTAADDDERSLHEVIPTQEMSDPADLLIRDEEIAGVRKAFSEVLSDFETEVLLLYVEGKSYQDIARVLHRGVKAIDNALQRIKRKLEQSLRGEPAPARSA